MSSEEEQGTGHSEKASFYQPSAENNPSGDPSKGPEAGSKKSNKEAEVTSGKYILIEIPNFNDAGEGKKEKENENEKGSDEPMTTYLRLGAVKDVSIAASSSAPRASGEDLAGLVTSFIDDTRKREGCPDYLSPEERQKETAKLHTKGGWRDHSDGNRITTTRGDKVEVVKGNYKMVVLGRQNDKASWDVSGGHVAQSSITYDGGSSIEYTTEDYGGTWVVVEKTVKGHVHNAYHGKVYDYYCGELRESITGSEDASEKQPNPDITEKTWAKAISSYTGSESCRVPSITDETWADAMASTVDAKKIAESKTVSGSITSTTTAGSLSDKTTVSGDVTSKTDVTGDMSDETKAKAITSTTTADSITSTTTADEIKDTTKGNVTSTTTGDVDDTITGTSKSTIMGEETEIIMGAVTEVEMGAVTSVSMGVVTDMMLGLQIELCLAGNLEFSVVFKYEADAGPAVRTSPTFVHISPLVTVIGKFIAG